MIYHGRFELLIHWLQHNFSENNSYTIHNPVLLYIYFFTVIYMFEHLIVILMGDFDIINQKYMYESNETQLNKGLVDCNVVSL